MQFSSPNNPHTTHLTYLAVYYRRLSGQTSLCLVCSVHAIARGHETSRESRSPHVHSHSQ